MCLTTATTAVHGAHRSDGGPAWTAVHGPDADDVVRADTLEVLGARLHLTRYVPRPRSEATP